jgi:hypothetical protein
MNTNLQQIGIETTVREPTVIRDLLPSELDGVSGGEIVVCPTESASFFSITFRWAGCPDGSRFFYVTGPK